MYQPKHAKKEYKEYDSYYVVKKYFNDILNSLDETDYVKVPLFFFQYLKDFIVLSKTKD